MESSRAATHSTIGADEVKHFATGGVVSVSPDKIPLIGERRSAFCSVRPVEPISIGVDWAVGEVFSVVNPGGNFTWWVNL